MTALMTLRTEGTVIKHGGCKGSLHDYYIRLKDRTVVEAVGRGLAGANSNGD